MSVNGSSGRQLLLIFVKIIQTYQGKGYTISFNWDVYV